MKKCSPLLTLLLVLPLLQGCSGDATPDAEVDDVPGEETACVEACANADVVCPSLALAGNCVEQCDSWSAETRESVRSAADCAALSAIPEFAAGLVPEMEDPNLAPAKNDCEAACGNYVNTCLTLVPGAGQALFQEGLTSCMEECAGWDEQKTACMASAADCESMTNICGL
ncbi:MAG: hypothetical protein PHU04_05605 [Candidatus Peribacteraceae bacterium]|nr:hypothetical protein [Candidatus Peribacteraceae bacterium]